MKLTLFALQVFLPMETTGGLRRELTSLAAGAPAGMASEDKRRFYGRFGGAVAAHAAELTLGVWDYLEDVERAEGEYRRWWSGTLADAREAGGRDASYRASGRPGFMFVTVLFLMRRGGSSDRFVCEACRMHASAYFRRATLARLLSSLGLLNFASIREDAILVRPRDDEWGIEAEELEHPSYAYLHRLT